MSATATRIAAQPRRTVQVSFGVENETSLNIAPIAALVQLVEWRVAPSALMARSLQLKDGLVGVAV